MSTQTMLSEASENEEKTSQPPPWYRTVQFNIYENMDRKRETDIGK